MASFQESTFHFQVEPEKYELLCAVSNVSSTKGRGHRSRGGGVAAGGSKKPSSAAVAVAHINSSSMLPSNSEDVSSDESDSDSSYLDSNESEEETSNGSSLKSGPSSVSVPCPASSRPKLRGKLGMPTKVSATSVSFCVFVHLCVHFCMFVCVFLYYVYATCFRIQVKMLLVRTRLIT